jgi:hypothetical protein
MMPPCIIRYGRITVRLSTSHLTARKANAAASATWHRVCEAFTVRNQLLLIGAVLLTGCATQQPAVQTVTIPPAPSYASAALVFDAPITLTMPYIDISRDDRGQAALVGYEEGGSSTYDIVSDDRRSNDFSDGYVRESFTERTGITHR